MGWFDSDKSQGTADAYSEQQPHQAAVSHELLAGAAAYEAARAFEKHQEANGKVDSHAKAKELLAAFAGAFIDREAETRG
ncbi:hypothetical protein M422DRAFT_146996, partial [Sphaerobolus stellatus SS14]